MTPDDIINTKPEEENPAGEATTPPQEEPVKRRRKKKNFFDRFDITSFVEYENIAANLSYVVFIAILMLFYIWNNHYAQRSVNAMSKNDKRLKELKWQYIYSKSELECKSQQSEVAKMVRAEGIKELKNPPVKILLTADGKN